MAKLFVILVNAPGPCWYCDPGDEDESTPINTTTDPAMAQKWADFSSARTALRTAVKRYPERSFQLTVEGSTWVPGVVHGR